MASKNNNPQLECPKKKTINMMTGKIVVMIAEEVNKVETQIMIKRKIILPVINMIYAELYPYIVALIITILSILLLSILTFCCFVLYYLRKG